MAKKKSEELSDEIYGGSTETFVPNESKPAHISDSLSDYTMEVVTNYDGKVDPFFLEKKDPNYEYYFLRDEHKNLVTKTSNMLLQKGGWQLCPREHLVRIGIKEREISPDGFCRRGENILAFMPKKLYEQKMAHKNKMAKQPVDAVKRMLTTGDPSAGGFIHESMRGIQTGKKLGFKTNDD